MPENVKLVVDLDRAEKGDLKKIKSGEVSLNHMFRKASSLKGDLVRNLNGTGKEINDAEILDANRENVIGNISNISGKGKKIKLQEKQIGRANSKVNSLLKPAISFEQFVPEAREEITEALPIAPTMEEIEEVNEVTFGNDQEKINTFEEVMRKAYPEVKEKEDRFDFKEAQETVRARAAEREERRFEEKEPERPRLNNDGYFSNDKRIAILTEENQSLLRNREKISEEQNIADRQLETANNDLTRANEEIKRQEEAIISLRENINRTQREENLALQQALKDTRTQTSRVNSEVAEANEKIASLRSQIEELKGMSKAA